MLTGVKISVVHAMFGSLFTTIVTPVGTMVWPEKNDPQTVFTLTTDQILTELYKWGFVVTYQQVQYLPADQLAYLVTLQGLGYDKIRTLTPFHYVLGQPVFTTRIVAFLIAGVTADWLDNTFSPTDAYYADALSRGKVIDIGAMSSSHHWDWTWLTTVANIADIVAQNGGGAS
jgi:hypothetical protein